MRVRIGCAVAVAVASVVLQACGDGGGDDAGATLATPDTSETSDTQVEPDAEEASGDVTAESDADEPTEDVAAEEPAAGTAIAVDPAALPIEPSGYDALAEELCALYAVEDLDAFFGGAGGLASSSPLGGGCRWAVDGLPRTHYVDVELTDEGTVFGIMEGERLEIAGVEVHLQRGPADAWATMPTPDGRFITILVHGDFDVDLRALDGGLDPAATALAENLLERF